MRSASTCIWLSLLALSSLGCGKSGAGGPSAEAAHATGSASPAVSATPAAVQKAASQLAAGDPAPNVTFTMQDGRSISLASLAGKEVAVYFYPKDETSGCTVQAQGIRDSWPALQQAGVVVIGVSTQDAASHKAFIAKEKLPFDLAVDADEAVAKAFGVPVRAGFASRQTFLVGKDGRLKKVWREVKPQDHAAEILAASKST